MAALDSQEDIKRFVRRRIRRDWRGDIEVLAVNSRREGLLRKKVHVLIGCNSYLACEQARISLAAFVANQASDWEARHWKVVEGADHPLRLELIEPKPEGYEAVE